MVERWKRDKKFCYNCGSETTYKIFDKRVNKKLYRWRYKNESCYCLNCFHKLFEIKNRMLFKKKRVYLKDNPRKGVCELCGNIGDTDMHHTEYHDDNPLKDTIELCNGCHAKQEIRKTDPTNGRFVAH